MSRPAPEMEDSSQNPAPGLPHHRMPSCTAEPPTSSAFQAYFSQPMVATAVIVHLVTDGTYYGDQKQETISVQLLDTNEQSHDLGEHMACPCYLPPHLPVRGL